MTVPSGELHWHHVLTLLLQVSEEDKQYLLQIVERHRKECPDANKSTVLKSSVKKKI